MKIQTLELGCGAPALILDPLVLCLICPWPPSDCLKRAETENLKPRRCSLLSADVIRVPRMAVTIADYERRCLRKGLLLRFISHRLSNDHTLVNESPVEKKYHTEEIFLVCLIKACRSRWTANKPQSVYNENATCCWNGLQLPFNGNTFCKIDENVTKYSGRIWTWYGIETRILQLTTTNL